MTTIEQAREVSKRLRYGAYVDGRDLQAADTIDALLAKLATITTDHDEWKEAAIEAYRIAGTLPALKQEPFGYVYEGIEYPTKGRFYFSKKASDNVELCWWTPGIPVYAKPQLGGGNSRVPQMTEYHLNDEGGILLDEYGNPIPITVCLCAAHEPNECVCGAWDDVEDWYD